LTTKELALVREHRYKGDSLRERGRLRAASATAKG